MSARNEVIRFLHEVSGPVVGLEALRALFPRLARCTLEDLLRRYRKVWSRRYRQAGFRLTWRRAGAVWAIDFSQPLQPIDGVSGYLFAVRDLASHYQLAWLPFRGETAEETIHAMEDLFREHGPPLVIKSDNGSAFIAATFRELLRSWRIEQLFSPPRHPQYNGALERSNGTLKTYTQLQAARQGHPFRWTSEDVDTARQLANTLTRPWGYRGATPEEAWKARGLVTAADREAFQDAVARHRVTAADDLGLNLASELAAKDQARLDRLALSRALVELDQLEMQRVDRAPRQPPRRSRSELVRRAITAPGVPRLTYQPTRSADVSPGAAECAPQCAVDQAAQGLPARAARLSVSNVSLADGYKKLLALPARCDRMLRQPTDGGRPATTAPPSQLAHGERASRSWLRGCLALILRFAKAANISHG